MNHAKQEKYLELMMENSPDPLLLLDREARIVSVSKVFCDLTGTVPEEIQGVVFAEIYKKFASQEFIWQSWNRFHQVMLGRKSVANDVSIDFSGTGKPRNYSIHSSPMVNERGGCDGVLAIYRDITELLRVESDERIRVMFDSAPLACTFWDAEGALTDCNQEALTLFKVSSKEEFCRRFFEFSPALQADGNFSRDRIVNNFRRTLEKGKMHCSWLHRDSEGEWIPSDVTLVRVNFRDGYRVVGYTRDLRDIQAAEDRRREADERNRELEIEARAAKAATDAKSRFLASMSHEIRTPMNAIIGMSDLMRTDNLDEEQRSFFDDIKKMSRTLLQIINDILDISKIEVGKMEIFPVHFNLHELYDHICSLSRFTAESKDLEFRSFFDPGVPHVIYGDDVRIRQIVTNLINNAVKYTQSGSVEFDVTKVLRNNRDCLSFAVRDTGIGIRKEDFDKLFNNFQQLDSQKNRGIIGTGLGLAITKNLLNLMEGDVEFDSEYGKGSVFTAFIPLVPGDPEKVEKKILQSRVMAAEGTRILVVDDNKTNLKVALAFLAVHGIRAETAAGGEEALEKLKANAYDLVFMDHMMPGMDGVEAARAIRALSSNGEDRFAKMPIIALTANAVSGAREQFIEA
ncbi:MAG: PAS domain-containing protein, partial [Treponema sp.]|nr:PAS domain-containing protein [Treponema sp.]